MSLGSRIPMKTVTLTVCCRAGPNPKGYKNLKHIRFLAHLGDASEIDKSWCHCLIKSFPFRCSKSEAFLLMPSEFANTNTQSYFQKRTQRLMDFKISTLGFKPSWSRSAKEISGKMEKNHIPTSESNPLRGLRKSRNQVFRNHFFLQENPRKIK